MLELNLQLFGGRGADSGYGGGTHTGGGRRGPTRFDDKTKQFQGMTIHEFEEAIRDRKVEYVGIFDKDGQLVVAGTSHNKGAVAIPVHHPEFKSRGYTLTHNHPYYEGRTIGGSFSEADVQNHLGLGLKGETRAVTNGPNEFAYIFRARKGAKLNTKGMMKAVSRVGKDYGPTGQRTLDSVNKRLKAQGKTLNGKEGQVIIGAAKRLWKAANVGQYGYEYIDVTKKRW